MKTRLAMMSFALANLSLLMATAWAQSDTSDQDSLIQESDMLMAEEYRTAINKVVVLPGRSPSTSGVTGSYRKKTDGLVDGIYKGEEIGIIRKDIGGIPVSFPIPVLRRLGGIFGGVSGAITRQVQDFRDAMTKDLAATNTSPLSNEALADDVFWRLRDVPGIDPKVYALTTPIPEETDAILYVSFSDASINVDGKIATINFSATATLRRMSDGQHLYENTIHYQDTDTLANWTKDDKAAWRDYANYARHYVGREIVAEIFERVDVQQTLRPVPTNTVKRVKKEDWKGITTSSTPTLEWSLDLKGDDKQAIWAKSIEPRKLRYDVEIYDKHQLIYVAKQVSGMTHTVEAPLPDCKTYRWSVRPAYDLNGIVRYGEWMRSDPDTANGNRGQAGSEASAYIYDFASLEVKCRR